MNSLKGVALFLINWACRNRKTFLYLILLVFFLMAVALAAGKTYQHWDRDSDRGALPIQNGALGESFSSPVYLDQGWSNSDSLWFYTTTQGSNLLPYDFFLVLKAVGSDTELFRSDHNIDKFRYLVQKPTFFNPDGLPLGFALDEYDGKDYVGYTCAACHTGQVNYRGQAIRIDGGPAMADMDGFLIALSAALTETQSDTKKRAAFVKDVLALDNNYEKEQEVLEDLEYWVRAREQYNIINHSEVDYGYARLDAFGRIYNRVLQYIINRDQLKKKLLSIRKKENTQERLLSSSQVEAVLSGINATIIRRDDFLTIVDRLISNDQSKNYPGLSLSDIRHIRNYIFNEPNAPVSYPFLWDTTHSDYVQWNGLASNAGPGPLGRNVGEVTGVFATLDWQAHKPWYAALNIPARVSGQENKSEVVKFTSSVDLINLQRLETHLQSLSSPAWPEDILGAIDRDLADQGEIIYAEYCQSCHEIIDPKNWDRIIIGQMSSLDSIQTDPAMAENSVMYMGSSGNFKHTYQKQNVGKLIIPEEAPVAVILTQATRGMVSTPDADKGWLRRILDWLYIMAMSFFDNDIKASVKNGDYYPDTTAKPFDSLLAYKARPLNGIWATAPFLHNGSVPTMYDLFLPVCDKSAMSFDESTSSDSAPAQVSAQLAADENDNEEECRPEAFMVGSREFDPVKMGFKSEGYEGFLFKTDQRGNLNTGHEYAAGKTPRADGKVLPPLRKDQRMALIEFIKTL